MNGSITSLGLIVVESNECSLDGVGSLFNDTSMGADIGKINIHSENRHIQLLL